MLGRVDLESCRDGEGERVRDEEGDGIDGERGDGGDVGGEWV